MAKLHVAFLWHYHQPYYMDPATGRFAMPWVRLHAVKDYAGMANLLAEFPRVRPVINFAPSLVRQINEYIAGTTDAAMMLARAPAASLSFEETAGLLRAGFALNHETMIHPHPPYRELLNRCRAAGGRAEDVVDELAADDLRDIQAWGNLAAFHPTVIEKDLELRELIRKGRGFTEGEKQFVLDRQLEVMAEILPLYRRLADAGQIELSTSPFYHPIVPLLCDHTSARVARPTIELPSPMISAPEDAAAQTERAIAQHESTFGRRPRGMWPPEAAVSDDAAAVFAGAGIDWIVADEEVLERTLGIRVSRDDAGTVEQARALYRPYRLSCGGRELAVLFRDSVLSDLIGFAYHLRRPHDAARDLLGHLERIRRKAPDDALVVIALDGENCWEFYPNQGVVFLRHLYRLLSETSEIETTHISEYLDRFGPGDSLDTIFPGSWVGHCFAPWMGHWEKNLAWEHLARARELYEAKVAEGGQPPEKLEAALEELYIAEGSDWFWWYGEDHAAAGAAEFDALFRKHVRKVYELLGATPPDVLQEAVVPKPERESWEQANHVAD